MIKQSLKNEIRSAGFKANIKSVTTGVLGDRPTIEIVEHEPLSFTSYPYDTVADRDKDFAELNEALKQ